MGLVHGCSGSGLEIPEKTKTAEEMEGAVRSTAGDY